MAKRLKTITAGRLVTACLYTIPKYRKDDSPHTRAEKQRVSSAGRAKLNNLKSAQKFEQLAYCNFGRGDLYLTLTYAPEHLPDTRRDVLRDFRRFRRRLVEAGWPHPTYLYVPEHKHGDAQWHIHLLLNGPGGDSDWALMCWELESAWDRGIVNVKAFPTSFGDISALAAYLTKERPEVGDHGYIGSRDLRTPIPYSSPAKDSDYLSLPAGAYALARSSYKNEYGEYQYLKYYLPMEGDQIPTPWEPKIEDYIFN